MNNCKPCTLLYPYTFSLALCLLYITMEFLLLHTIYIIKIMTQTAVHVTLFIINASSNN